MTRRLLPVFAAVLYNGGCIDYTIFARLPGEEPEVCEITEFGFLTCWDPSRDVFQGRAVALWSLGTGPTTQSTRKLAVAGAPGRDDDDLQGTVRIHDGSLVDGSFPSWVPAALPTPTGTRRQFGGALFTADIKNCQLDGAYWVGCGQELLVGAPDRFTHSTTGRAFLYESSPGLNNDDLRLLAEISVPATVAVLNAGDEFGASFAAPRSVRSLADPWEVAPDAATWVAIGAPGRSSVFVFYELDATVADPFADAASRGTVVELPGPWSGRDFGYALVAGDFDADGHPDLAVGAPEQSPYDLSALQSPGSVVMYWGTSDTSQPLYPFENPLTDLPNHVWEPLGTSGMYTDPTMEAEWICHTSWGTKNCTTGGGTVLAAGPVAYGDSRDALFVGYPNHNDMDGRVCQVMFTPYTPTNPRPLDPGLTRCFGNPLDMAASQYEFGYGLAVGDFNPVDTWGATDSEEARLVEVAISSPAAARTSAGGLSEQGLVDVFKSGPLGIDEYTLFREDLVDKEGVVAGGRFGEYLATGYVHQAPWEDLIAGSPRRSSNRGNATTTVALNPQECPGEVEGKWTVTDLATVSQEVHTYNHVSSNAFVLQFASGFQLELRESNGTGALCTSTDPDGATFTGEIAMPPDSKLVLDSRWTCSGSSQTWTGQDAKDIINQIAQLLGHPDKTLNAEVDVTITNTGSGTATFEITFSKLNRNQLGVDSSCNLVPGPFSMTFDRATCETP